MVHLPSSILLVGGTVDPTPIKLAALNRRLTLKALGSLAEINTRRWYRLIEDLAVPTEEELLRISAATQLPLSEVREAFGRGDSAA